MLLQNLGTDTKLWMRDRNPSSLGSRPLVELARKPEVAGKRAAGNERLIRRPGFWLVGTSVALNLRIVVCALAE